MADFNNLTPGKNITDPQNVGAVAEWPRHVYRPTAVATDTSLIVAWKGKQPVHNEVQSVIDDVALAAALKDGCSLTPVIEDAKAKK